MNLLVIHAISKLKKEGPVEAMYHLLNASLVQVKSQDLQIRFEIVTFQEPNKEYVKKFQNLKIKINVLNNPRKLISFLLKKQKNIIFHSHCTRSILFSLVMFKCIRVHSCQIVIGLQAKKMHGFLKGSFINFLNKLMYHFQDKLIFSSKAVQNSLSQNLSKRGSIIYNFISNSSIIPKKYDYLITIARLSSEKNIEEMIRFHSNLKLKIKLLIVGDGLEKEKLKQLIGSNQNIELLGFRDDIESLISNCLAYVASSKTEGLPMAVLQAISGSKPLLLSDIEPHQELIEGNGHLYEIGNQEDFHKKLLDIVQNYDVYSKGSTHLSKSKFNPDKLSNKYIQFISK